MKTKTVNVHVSHEAVRSHMAEFLAFAFYLQESMEDKSMLSYLNNCPVSKEMIGTAFLTVMENLIGMGCIDTTTLVEINKNIASSVKIQEIPAGLRHPPVLM